MNAWTIGWFICLAQIKYILCAPKFYLDKGPLTATEGSCTKIKCSVDACVLHDTTYWFWMKDPQWNETDFIATIIYSTNNVSRPVSPDFATRVTYIGSPPATWEYASISQSKDCSILICNLNKSDSGNYSFRFTGPDKWKTKDINLTVTENPCLITFEQPPLVNESATIKLTCSTPSACSSRPQIKGLAQLYETSPPEPQQGDGQQKSTTVSFKANWKDDGKQISCQTEANTDTYLIRNISLTIEYAPKEIQTVKTPETIKERDTVTLSCSAKGRPDPTFTWYKGEQNLVQKRDWTIEEIQESHSGDYYCVAENKHGKVKSDPVNINVSYAPEVKIKMTPPASYFDEGDEVTLTCNVTRSNPQPHTFSWFKNSARIWNRNSTVLSLQTIRPEDAGSYTCEATNSVNTGASQPVRITVRYGPRRTRISTKGNNKVGNNLTLTCDTDAYPLPGSYSWYRYNNNKKLDSSQWKFRITSERWITMKLQRKDEACYSCNATNIIRTGENSEPVCIRVLYPPTNLTLSMNTEVTEGQLITISCTVDSFPRSWLTLTRTSKTYPRSSESHFPKHDIHEDFNRLQHTFNVTYMHAGRYTCEASNSQGPATSEQRDLVVKYPPKDVTVEADPAFTLNENLTLTLKCKSKSYPDVTLINWMKITDGKSKLIHDSQTFQIKSVRPSDNGKYICEAKNAIGTGQSQQAEVKVKYGPKHTKITSAAEVQEPDGRRWIMLSCSSHCYPSVDQYSWYRKADAENKMDRRVSSGENYKVYSDDPGEYYCIAKNEINQRSSDPVPLFVNERLIQILRFCLIFLILLVVIVLIFVYRQRRKKSSQRRTTSTPASSGFLSWWNCARPRNLRNDPVMAEPFRSRDDLLPDQPCRPNGQRRQPPPDSTPASNVNTVYSTVNLPAAKQGPSAQRPVRQNGGRTEQESLNYAALHFENKQKGKQAKAEESAVYAVVSKQKLPKKNEQGNLPDYENVTAAKSPDPLSSDTSTSEDELELNYSKVSFKAKKGHQGERGRDASSETSSDTSSDSSTSDDETQYSQVKV